MRILVTGGTGFLGRPLCGALTRAGHDVTVQSRSPAAAARALGAAAARVLGPLDAAPDGIAFDAVVNLAGAPVIDRRWSAARRRELRASRVDATRALVRRLAARPPAALLSASAVGYYPTAGEGPLDERAPPDGGFLGRLCADWEEAARSAAAAGTRVCLLRTGLVLHPSGGALGRMLPPFRLGLGGRLGSGRQWMSWIALDDWLALVLHLLENPAAAGAFNLTAPAPVTNAAFTASLGRALRRPAPFPVPAALLRLALGARAGLLLEGRPVLPARALALGFRFRYPELDGALAAMPAPDRS